jgi:hypothetical protein
VRVLLAAQQAEQLAQDDIRAPEAMGIGALFLGSQRLAPTESGLLMESSNVLGGLIRATIEADATMSIYIQNIGEIIKHRDETKVLTINDRALVLLLRQLIRAVRQIIDEKRYRGPWWFGVRANGFQDARAHSQQRLVNDLFGRTEPVGVSLTRNEYERVVAVSATTVETDTGSLTEDLVGDLLHQLGCKPAWKGRGYLA